MNNNTDAVNFFRQYAESRMKEHLAELHTNYENRQLPLRERQVAFDTHLVEYRLELDARMTQLSRGDESLHDQLQKVYQKYEHDFKENFGKNPV